MEKLRQQAQEENWTKQEKAKHLVEIALENLEIPLVVKVAMSNMGFLETLYNLEDEQLESLIDKGQELLDFLKE